MLVMKLHIKKYRLYELFQDDENVQIVADVKNIIRLTAVWTLKCDKSEAEPKSSSMFLREQLRTRKLHPSIAFPLFFPFIHLGKRSSSFQYEGKQRERKKNLVRTTTRHCGGAGTRESSVLERVDRPPKHCVRRPCPQPLGMLSRGL